MRILSVLCFVIGGLLAMGGFINASKPSVSPIITVIGSFVVPGLFIWWGAILHRRANAKRDATRARGS